MIKQTTVWIAALVAITVITTGCAKKKEDTGAVTERYTAGPVTLRDVIAQTGEVRPVLKVDLQSEASGRIEKLYVKEGQQVKKGDRILSIDPLRLENRKKTLDLSVREAKINYEQAKRNYEQAQELFKTGAVSQRDLDDLKNGVELKDINYQRQLIDLEDVTDQLDKTVVKAPMTGVLTVLNVEEGEMISAVNGSAQNPTNIGTVADVSHLEVVTQIGEVDYVHLNLGQKVIIKPEAIPGAQTYGTIDFVALSAKKKNADELGTFEVRAAIDSIMPGIVPGINVNVEFVVLEKKDVLGVPYHVVKKRGDKTFVLVPGKNKNGKDGVRPQNVTVGTTDYKNYEITDGLKAGDVVIFKSDSTGGDKKNRKPGAPPRGR